MAEDLGRSLSNVPVLSCIPEAPHASTYLTLLALNSLKAGGSLTGHPLRKTYPIHRSLGACAFPLSHPRSSVRLELFTLKKAAAARG